MVNFNSAHQEGSIEVRFITVPLLEPNFPKRGLKRGYFTRFSRFYGTGSARTQPEVSKFNSVHREHSIEGCNITLALVEPKISNFTQKGAIFLRVFSGFTEPEVAGRNRKHQNSTQLIERIP